MRIISDDRISVQQFKHFKQSITKALDKKLALNKSFKISEEEYSIKYPFIKELKETVSKSTNKIEQIDEMSVILNNHFNTAWKEQGQKSINLKRKFEKDLEKILFLIYSKNDLLKKGLDPLKIKYDELENSLTYTNSKVDNSYQEIKDLKEIAKKNNQNILDVTKETKKNKSDFDKGFTEIKEKIKQNKADFNKKFKETNNEISKIKDKAKPKKRETLKRRENINRIESEFKILISDLNKFPNYESKQKVLSYKKDKLTDLQTYQILLLFFQNKYNFNTKNTNEIIYSLFNNYFGNLTEIKKSGITIMDKGNWKEYKLRKHLSNVENEELYSQLNLFIKR